MAPTSGEGGQAGSAAVTSGAGGASPRDILDTSLTVDLATESAIATLTFAPTGAARVALEVGDLLVRRVHSNDLPSTWLQEGARLELDVPPSARPPVVTIEYDFAVRTGMSGVSASYTYSWPYFCGNVFPCNSQPADGGTFHLSLSGARATAIYPRTIATDAPAYMPAWAVGDYTRLDLGTTLAGTQVSVWHLPGGEAQARTGAIHLRSAFEWMEQRLGTYRFGNEVGSVAVPWEEGSGGMEHHPYWHVAESSMSDVSVHVHEAVHGWFGNGVRLRCWEDFVLSEGTVSYLTARLIGELGDVAGSRRVWAGYEAELARFDARPVNIAWPQSCGDVDVLEDGLFSRVPYVKGAYFYAAVERRVGRPLLDQALRTFYERFAGRAAGMQDMLAVIEEITRYDAGPCAQAWLMNAATPLTRACP